MDTNTNKYNIKLTLRERLVIHRLTNMQEESFLNLANESPEALKQEFADEEDDMTPMEYSEHILDRLNMYESIRRFPNTIFDYPNATHSEAITYALSGIREKFPNTHLEVRSIYEKIELVRKLEQHQN